jgi:hypothetical protein
MIMKSARQQLLVMLCLLALLLNGSTSTAQDIDSIIRKKVADRVDYLVDMSLFPEGTVKLLGARSFGKVVKGAPYSATAITEHIQTLGDGNKIIRKNETKIYRDSEGRTRREQKLETLGKLATTGDAPQMIYISDPVAGVSYNLDPRTRTARRGREIKAFDYVKQTERVNEKIKRELEERVKREEERQRSTEERLKRNAEQESERARRSEELIKERALRLQEQEKERKVQMEEREKQMRERNKERDERMKEMMKEHEERAKELSKEREERSKELSKEREAQEKERVIEREKRLKEMTKEREIRMKEVKEERAKRDKQLLKEREILQKERIKERKERVEKTRKEITRVDMKQKPAREIANPDGNKKIEALGKQTIEGVEVEGRRATRTIAAGEIGNLQPIEIVDETWYSPDLQEQVMTKHSDPRSGVTTYRLINISRREPERSLFEVPTDYSFNENSVPKKATKPEAPEPAKKPEPKKPSVQFL